MTKTCAVSLEDGTEINITVSDEPWRGDINVTDQEAVTEGLFLRAACQKCGHPALVVETGRLFLREFLMKDLPALRVFSLPAKKNRHLGGDWEGLKDKAFLRCYTETQYVFFDYDFQALFRRDQELRETRSLGLIRFSPEEPSGLDYALRLEAKGQGYATKAGLTTPRYAETELGFTAVKIRVVLENRTDCAVVAKIEEQWNRVDGAPQCRLFIKRESSVYKG